MREGGCFVAESATDTWCVADTVIDMEAIFLCEENIFCAGIVDFQY